VSRVPSSALVLTAGLGTRLRPLTWLKAKPALPLAGVPIITRILTRLAAFGVRDVVLNLHHVPESITELVGDGSDLGLRVRYSWEQPILGSAGGPRRALGLIDADPFLIVNGDTLDPINLAMLATAHAASGALVTLALTPQPNPFRFGGVIVENGGQVTGFAPPGTAHSGHHFAGAQIVQKEAYGDLPEGRPLESVKETYPELIRRRPGAVHAAMFDTPGLDVGTIDDYLRIHSALAAETPGVGNRSTIAESASLHDTIVWNDVTIGPECRLEECIVTDGVVVPPKSSFHRAILVPSDRAVPFDVQTSVSGVSVVRWKSDRD
jgi:mannose-1-phosphate guanylyltransferase